MVKNIISHTSVMCIVWILYVSAISNTIYAQQHNKQSLTSSDKELYKYLQNDMQHTLSIVEPVIGLTWTEHQLFAKKKNLAKQGLSIIKKLLKNKKIHQTQFLLLIKDYLSVSEELEQSIRQRVQDQQDRRREHEEDDLKQKN